MKTLLTPQNWPVLPAILVGATLGVVPFFYELAGQAAVFAHVLGALIVLMAVKRLARPGPFDAIALIGLGAVVALVPIGTLVAQLGAIGWVKIAAGAIVAATGAWHYLPPLTRLISAEADDPEEPAPDGKKAV